MKTRAWPTIIFGAAAIALLLWLGVYAYENIGANLSQQEIPSAPKPPAVMTAFLVARPNLIVDGFSLAKVEVWAVPAGSEASEEGHLLLGEAELHSSGDSLTQIWTLGIPENRFLASQIFARAFDENGAFVGQMYLPYVGAPQIYDALWGGPEVASSTVDVQRNFSLNLKVGGEARAGSLSVALIKIESDSRCPRNAICIWGGEVEARFSLKKGDAEETILLRSTGSPYVFEGYRISITGVAPARSGNPPAAGEYVVTLSVQRI